MIEPVVLADAATLTEAATIKTLDSAKMTPPSNRPMLVRDICIAVRHQRDAFTWKNPAMHLQIKIEAGRFVLTQGFVPAWLLGSVPDKAADYGGTISTILNAGQDLARVKWILPKPMYLPPNTQLKVTLQQAPLFTQPGGFSLLANISARGLLLDKGQSVAEVPYVSAFVPLVGNLQSAQLELCNVLDKPVTIQRLLGRIAWQTSQAAGTSTNFAPAEDDALGFRGDEGSGDPLQAVPRAFSLLLKDSMGVALTSGPTSEYLPFWSVFAPGAGGWNMPRVLAANEHITAILSKAPTATQRPMISMVGHRTERI